MKVNIKKQLDKNSSNKNIVVYSLAFVFLFMLVVVPLIDKGTKAIDDTGEVVDSLSLNCPGNAIAGEEFECNILLNSTSIISKGLTFKYGIPSGISHVEFNTDLFEVYSNDWDGVVLVNLDGVSGKDISVGTLKLKSSTLTSDFVNKIQLVDITIGDGFDTVINLSNVSDNVLIYPKSDINTLGNITLSSGSLNETFDKDKLEYTVTTDVDKMTINAVATDSDKAIVTGDVGVEKELHYGTNIFNIVVTSESGIEKTYVVNVFRTYEFNTDKYVYNKEDNYIYVGTDNDNLLDNITIEDGLNKKIENDKLVISFENEELLSINILSIGFDKYQLVDKTLYVDEVLPESEFILNVDYSEGIKFDLSESGIVKVLYGDVLLDTYDMVVYKLDFDSNLLVDKNNSYIKHLSLNTTVIQLLDKVTVVGAIAYINNASGNVKDSDEMIATGDKLVVYLGDTLMDEYELSVLGDSSGDGKLSTIDIAQFRKHLVNWVNPNTGIEFELTGVYSESFDLNKDGRISVLDLALMRKMLVGLI